MILDVAQSFDVLSVCPFCKVKQKSANHYDTYSVLIITKYTHIKKKKPLNFFVKCIQAYLIDK